jgi:hypothetical protein
MNSSAAAFAELATTFLSNPSFPQQHTATFSGTAQLQQIANVAHTLPCGSVVALDMRCQVALLPKYIRSDLEP